MCLCDYRYDIHMKTPPPPKQRGGARKGAGRTEGSGPYAESTKIMRIPHSVVPEVSGLLNARRNAVIAAKLAGRIFLPQAQGKPVKLPLYGHKVPAGFPSPADDYIEERLSLDQHLVAHKEATFFVRATGNSMVNAGIFDGDLLVVDKSIAPVHGHIVIAVIDGELTVKRLYQRKGTTALKAENPRYKDIELKEGQELQIWGVVTSTIKKLV